MTGGRGPPNRALQEPGGRSTPREDPDEQVLPGRQAAADAGYVPHIRRIGEEKVAVGDKHPDGKPRRWVVERTHAWLCRCRAILVRYAKKGRNYLGLIQLACGLLWYRRVCRVKALG